MGRLKNLIFRALGEPTLHRSGDGRLDASDHVAVPWQVVLSSPILSYLILSYLILSYPILSSYLQ